MYLVLQESVHRSCLTHPLVHICTCTSKYHYHGCIGRFLHLRNVQRNKLENVALQIGFILLHRTMRKLATDVKVIPGITFTSVTSLRIVLCKRMKPICNISNMRIDVSPKSKCKFTPCLKVWKLKDPQMSSHFQKVFNLHVSMSAGIADAATEDI